MLDDLEDLVHTEVVRRLQSAVLTLEWQRLALLSVRLKLQERVINTVKQNLVVDMFAFSDQNAVHLVLGPSRSRWIATVLLGVVSLASFFAALLEGQVQVKRQHIGVLLFEVLTAANLGIVELLQMLDVVLGQGLVEGS